MMAPPVAGIDPHQDGFTVGVIDANGVELAHAGFDNRAAGFADAVCMLRAHCVGMVGVEYSASGGAHIAIAVVAAGFDAREVPPQRSANARRKRRLAKSDVIDSVAIASALLAAPTLGPVQQHPRRPVGLWAERFRRRHVAHHRGCASGHGSRRRPSACAA